jgi:hypothetical protein
VVLVLRQAQDEAHSQARQYENLILSLSKDEVFRLRELMPTA